MGALSPIRPATLTFGLAYPDRRAIEDEIERLSALLDAFDGDCDLEDDDPSGDPIEIYGELEDWRLDGAQFPLPVYDADQSQGLINEAEVDRAWRRHWTQGNAR